jgi:predicted DNA-binding transcriptional regulator AlpA
VGRRRGGWVRAARPGLEAFDRALGATAGDLDAGIRRIEVTPEAFEPETLLGATDIARMLGVSQQRFYQLMERPGFPAPATELARGALWRRQDIEAFAEVRSRPK